MKDIRETVLWYAAMRRIRTDKPTIIAITGSIAKTSTKAAVSILMKKAYPGQVHTAYGNLNSWPLGVPLAILDFKINFHAETISKIDWLKILWKAYFRSLFTKLPKYLVLEYGTDKPGDIKNICQKLPPDIGIITITGPAHLEQLGSVDEVAKDKGYVAETTKKDGLVLVNSEDPYLTQYHSRSQARIVSVFTELEDIAVKFTEALGKQLGLDRSVMAEALNEYTPPEGRLNYVQLKDIKLIDDSYNASPLAMKAAFHIFNRLPGKKLAIIGSMRELGANSPKYHKEVGALAAKAADKIIAVGPEAKGYNASVWYETSDEAAAHVLADMEGFGSILVKGSRGVHMEKIVQAIKNNEKTN